MPPPRTDPVCCAGLHDRYCSQLEAPGKAAYRGALQNPRARIDLGPGQSAPSSERARYERLVGPEMAFTWPPSPTKGARSYTTRRAEPRVNRQLFRQDELSIPRVSVIPRSPLCEGVEERGSARGSFTHSPTLSAGDGPNTDESGPTGVPSPLAPHYEIPTRPIQHPPPCANTTIWVARDQSSLLGE